ncbi:MAG: RNase adapter RapZ [Ruminococcaceae bacterium]|nr:RNase adapter RapZ [Oscillospiraceae bacterium]
MEFVVITGMSGAGKTQASNVMEDMGYYCIDNMPSAMIPYFAEVYATMPTKNANVAFIIDVRGENDFLPLLTELTRLKEKGYSCRTVFIDCEDRVLINRYKETRRVHPLVTLKNVSVNEALAMERQMLAPIQRKADYRIDTSTLTSSQLRDQLMAIFHTTRTDRMVITCMSFGYKYGIATEADLVFDVRCFPNPFYLPELKPLTGLDEPVRDYVFSHKTASDFMTKLYDMVDYLIPLYAEEGKTQLTIAIGCTGGKHRSVAMTEALAGHLKTDGLNVITVHRDIIKKFIGDK